MLTVKLKFYKNFVIKLFLINLLITITSVNCNLDNNNNDNIKSDNNNDKDDRKYIRINKCCERFEIFVSDDCTIAKEVNETDWIPKFTGFMNEQDVKVSPVKLAIGKPDCGPTQISKIFHYNTSIDKIVLLPDGKLRHYMRNPDDEDDFHKRHPKDFTPLYYDFEPGHYCIDKLVRKDGIGGGYAEKALVCSPERLIHWTDTDYLIRKIINPICHGISMSVFMAIAIIYFVLPSLRDLVGNIITTITLCLIVSQAANLVRIFTENAGHVSFLVADSILYASLLGAFFWLNSLGYYIWKTFRSRNVFLRVTDGRKYCWYSSYAWGSTIVLTAFGVFAHVFLDTPESKRKSMIEDQETIGWLGIAIFFTPIAFIIIVNIFFYISTMQIISRMCTYGRIHHKLKASFTMFSLIFLIMTIAWFFLILSWLHHDSLLYTHIVVNALQAPLMLYICVLRQKHVTFLLKKTCCYNEPPAATDWGDELTYMNGGEYNY